MNTSVDLDAAPPNAEAGPSTGPDTQSSARKKHRRTVLSDSEEDEEVLLRKTSSTQKPKKLSGSNQATPSNAAAGPSAGPSAQISLSQKNARAFVKYSDAGEAAPIRRPQTTGKSPHRRSTPPNAEAGPSNSSRQPMVISSSPAKPTTARELLGRVNIDSDSGYDSDVDYDLPAYEARPSGPSNQPSQWPEEGGSQQSPGKSSSQPRRSGRIRRPPTEMMSAQQLAEAHLRQNQSPQDRPSEKSPRKPRGKGRRGGKGRKRKQAYAEETEEEEEVASESDEELEMVKQRSLVDTGRLPLTDKEQMDMAIAASLHDIGILTEEQEWEMAIAASQREYRRERRSSEMEEGEVEDDDD